MRVLLLYKNKSEQSTTVKKGLKSAKICVICGKTEPEAHKKICENSCNLWQTEPEAHKKICGHSRNLWQKLAARLEASREVPQKRGLPRYSVTRLFIALRYER